MVTLDNVALFEGRGRNPEGHRASGVRVLNAWRYLSAPGVRFLMPGAQIGAR